MYKRQEQDCVREEETCRIAAARMEGLKQKAVYLSEESAKWEGRKAEFLAKKETSSSGVETLKRELSALRETGDVLAEQKNALVEKTARAQSDFDSSAALSLIHILFFTAVYPPHPAGTDTLRKREMLQKIRMKMDSYCASTRAMCSASMRTLFE